jgi:mono/diheme cytochrome c family protein
MDPNDPALRVPVEHWGCTNCHLPDAGNEQRIGRRPGPELGRVGERAGAEWLRRWIGDPASLRTAPTMPRLFGESEQDRADLEAVVQFLADRGQPAGGRAATEEALMASGRELYHQVGCVNCHGALDSPAVVFSDDFLSREIPEPFVFSPFSDLAGKWYPRALAAFLRDPVAVHRDGRMPAMNLSESESDHLAAYLLSKFEPASQVLESRRELVQRGREVFGERGCQACHSVGELEFEPFQAPNLAALASSNAAGGCLSSGEWRGPRYDFPAPPLVRMFASGIRAANQAQVSDARLDYLERMINRLNCRACHEIEGEGGVPEDLRAYCVSLDEKADLGDEGRFPPHLNGVGAKLTTGWFEQVLFESGRARPYLATRMPQFGAAVEGFSELFAHRAGIEANSDAEWPEVTDARVLAGREMMGMQAAACVSCHSFDGLPAIGTPGPDMTQFATRLRYEWWDAYIKDPAGFKPGTRMPLFCDESERGQSVFDEPFGGDFQAQTDAMWAYFSLGDFMPAPEDVGAPKSLVLTVGDHPRVFRTFLDSAGSRGIAVGFPLGIHYAYDAKGARLMEVWQGEFLDASGAWAGRGGNSTGARGEVLWKHPGGPTIVIGKKPAAWPEAVGAEAATQFKGYRVGSDGGPVFQYTIGEVLVVEQIVPLLAPRRRLERRFVFKGVPPGENLWIRLAGEVLQARLQGSGAHGPSDGAGGESWYRLAPGSSTCALILEVAL